MKKSDLRKYLEAMGIKKTHVARVLGMSRQGLEYYLKGDDEVPAEIMESLVSTNLNKIDEILKHFEGANLSAPEARSKIGNAVLAALPERKTKDEIIDIVMLELKMNYCDYFDIENMNGNEQAIRSLLKAAIK